MNNSILITYRFYSIFLLTLLVSGSAHATARVMGYDRFGNLFALPPYLCVSGRQELNLTSRSIDRFGYPSTISDFDILWKVYGPNFPAEQWAPSIGAPYSPTFRSGFNSGTIIFTVPESDGTLKTLEVRSRFDDPGAIQLVDDSIGFGNPNSCKWAPADLYGWGHVSPSAPKPSQDGYYPCFDLCVRNLKCIDRCPPGARCDSVLNNLGTKAWIIKDCPFTQRSESILPRSSSKSRELLAPQPSRP